MRGLVGLDLSDHVVLLGYHPGRTERIVAELTAEENLSIASCTGDDVDQHPMPDGAAVHFLRGDLTDDEVMNRACVDRARTAIIDGRDDNESLAIAVAVDHVKPEIRRVAALRDLGRREHMGYVNGGVQCVQRHMPFLLTEQALDPSITQVYDDLMSNGGHGNSYSVAVRQGFAQATVGDCQTLFGRSFAATLLAIRRGDSLVGVRPGTSPVEAETIL